MTQELRLIALDMDGVVNSSTLIRTWIANKYDELSHIEDPRERRLTARAEYFKEFNNGYAAVFPELASIITRICNEADAQILWTSTWRNGRCYNNIDAAKAMFNERGLPGDRLIGYTPDLGGDKFRCSRGGEIRSWLKAKELEETRPIRCAVIDDREDAEAGIPEYAKMFLVNEHTGITEELADKVIAFLKGEDVD